MPPAATALSPRPPAQATSEREVLQRLLCMMMPPGEASAAASRLVLRYGTVAAVVDAGADALRDGGFGLPAPVAAALARMKAPTAAFAEAEAVRARVAREARGRRRDLGAWFASRRHAAGLGQRELAAAVGLRCYSVVAQIEAGNGRVRWRDAPAWAAALDVTQSELAMRLLRAYEPELHALIAGGAGDAPPGGVPIDRPEAEA